MRPLQSLLQAFEQANKKMQVSLQTGDAVGAINLVKAPLLHVKFVAKTKR